MVSKSDGKSRNEKRSQFEAEAARQFALERYDILDTAEEDSFDHITMAMKMALDVPFAGISFMDGDRLWFKSKSGAATTDIPRDISFCDFAIAERGPTIVEDTLQDERFSENPVVINSPFLRSYIGVPLVTPDGYNIGTLCAADIIPRQYSDEKIDRMKQLAELVIHELELRQQAEKDRLTGALTRSGFSVEVQKAMSLYERQGIKSTLVIFDVDLYKMVSKRFGRPSGNALLRSIIQPLVRRLRRSDYIGRLGGTQFAVLLTCTVEEKAREATEKIQREMEKTNTEIYFDVGFCEITPAMGVCDDWLDQANINLLADKPAAGSVICEEPDKQYNMAGGAI
ncbi:sensor domain-containing diguanylate cyclase [Parasphingorhabdus sp. NYA22]